MFGSEGRLIGFACSCDDGVSSRESAGLTFPVRSVTMSRDRMAVDIIGRDEDLSALHAFLDRRADARGPAALALEGDAGIGKSTLWLAALETARERGLRVLTSRPAESERALAYAGLGDLFDEALGDIAPALPAPRRQALEVALLVSDPAGRAVDARALGVAVRSALELLAEDGLVLAIDDLQWLDASSASALGFALRRLPAADISLLWTRRLGTAEQSSAVEDALGPDRIERLQVGPLSAGALQHLLRSRLSRTVSRPTLLRLHEASGGNAFYALELARALESDGSRGDPTRPLPVPQRLEELVSARLGGFDGSTHEALVLVSAHGRLHLSELEAIGIGEPALARALDANVIELERGTVRFTHPLLGSVLYQGLSAAERQSAHSRLAGLAEDPVARARHLALSTDLPDEAVAAALEDAAAAAEAQGAPIVAAELGEHGLRLTAPRSSADLDRRTAAVARAHRAAGEVERGRALAQELLARAPAGAKRAEALVLLADFESEEPRRAIPLFEEALREEGVPPALRASIHQRVSLLVRFIAGLDVAEEHAGAAVALADDLGDDALRAAALAGLALIRFNAGKADGMRLAEQAHELARKAAERPVVQAEFVLAHVLFWASDFDRARPHLERLHREWSERDERSAAGALWYLAVLEWRLGRLTPAGAYAEESRTLSAQYARDDAESPQTLMPIALVAAHRGELAEARVLIERVRELADVHGSLVSVPTGMAGVVELWGGDPEAAAALFTAAEQTVDAPDVAEPCMSWWRAEQVEALLELGRIDDAVARLDDWEAAARRLDRRWALAHATRCRGLVAAARADVEAALRALEDAVSQHEAAQDPFGRGRALLALGVVRRRARLKRPARDAIEAARAGFEAMGAAGWAAEARKELGRIGGRTRTEGLTPAEERVAALVAKGQTNAEVAAALFLAERTVASHLTRVYSKLGVRSRTELSRRLR